MTFGQRLKKLREEKNMSQINVSRVLSIANSTLSLYESDCRKPDYELLIKLAAFYNVTTDYLLGISGVSNTPVKQDRVIHQLDVTGMPEEAVMLIDEYAQFIKEKYGPYRNKKKDSLDINTPVDGV